MVTNEDSSSPAMQMRPPHMVTILQPSLSHRDVARGPRKNMMPVAREPTQARKRIASELVSLLTINSIFV